VNLLNKKPFSDVVREMRERRQRLEDRVKDSMAKTGGFKATLRRGAGFLTLTKSTRPGVAYQLTYWADENTPTGHIDEPSIEDAVRDLSGAIELDF